MIQSYFLYPIYDRNKINRELVINGVRVDDAAETNESFTLKINEDVDHGLL